MKMTQKYAVKSLFAWIVEFYMFGYIVGTYETVDPNAQVDLCVNQNIIIRGIYLVWLM